MAFNVKIFGITEANEGWAWAQDNVSWWDDRVLAEDPRFREVPLNDGYLDYVAVLSPAEAKELADRDADKAMDWQQDAVSTLSEKLKDSALHWVVVNIYEWESGM
jgi:hypothetical protein